MPAQATSTVLTRLSQLGIVPVVRAQSPELGYKVVRTLVAAGFGTAEVTMTVPGAVEVIAQLTRDGEILVGAGTILDLQQAEASIRAGAQYLVSPCIVEGLPELSREAGVPCVMAGLTPTEIRKAWEMGSDAVKVFPASSIGGPAHLKAIKAVFPSIPLVPTGGVQLDNIGQYLAAGAEFVGVGSDLVNVNLIAQGNTEAVIELGRQYLKAVSDARNGG